METEKRLWIKDKNSSVGWRPNFPLRCPMCKPWWKFWIKAQRLTIEMGYVFAFSLRPPKERLNMKLEERDSFAMDIWSRCPRCGYSNVNGLPLARKEYEEKFGVVADRVKEAGMLKEDETVI
jgi:hypothetical protein